MLMLNYHLITLRYKFAHMPLGQASKPTTLHSPLNSKHCTSISTRTSTHTTYIDYIITQKRTFFKFHTSGSIHRSLHFSFFFFHKVTHLSLITKQGPHCHQNPILLQAQEEFYLPYLTPVDLLPW